MSTNINEAVFPPAVHNLRRMAQSSPTRNSVKGSYELYDPQQTSALDSPEKKGMPAIIGAAPGSPSSIQDYNQVIEKLQQELEQSRRKETELQQMLADLKKPLGPIHSMFLDNSYLEASPSNETIGENVKDAHIRHLQRQVTVLQANLYKSEGWANRVATAVKERDKALDEVARLTSRIKEMQDYNNQLLRKIESLSTSLQEAHKNVLQATEQLQNQHYSGQVVTQLKDEIHRQNCEIKTLQESLNRLGLENRSLKDLSIETNSQPLESLTCSQELEHLHKVVDKLKDIVLQQRSYLLQLRQASNASTPKSFLLPPAMSISDGLCEQESVTWRNSSSPKLRVSGTSPPVSVAVHEPMIGHPYQAMKSSAPKENMEIQLQSSSDYVRLTGGRKKLNSREMLEDTVNMDVLNLTSPLLAQTGGMVGMESKHMGNRTGYSYSTASQSPGIYRRQHLPGDVAKQNLGNTGLYANNELATSPVKSPQHRTLQRKSSQSDGCMLAMDGVSQSIVNSKSDGRQITHWSATNNSAALDSEDVSENMDTVSQSDVGLAVNLVQKYNFPRSQQEGRCYEATSTPKDTLGQFLVGGNSVYSGSNKTAQYGNINLNSATPQSQQIYHPPSNYQNGSVCVINHDMMGGGKMIIPASSTNSSALRGASQESVYVNSPGGQGASSATVTSSSVGQNPHRSNPNSDRLCPVCNNDFSHVSMEEFQTHVFQCFDDDDNPPETMKPPETAEKFCPMCTAKFSSGVPQAEYEKHVHSHFDYEGLGFEILQP